jgi:1,4-dihydroxy-2-naphthoyl-CoA synthase
MPMHMFTDVTCEAECGLTGITIHRPERCDAFRARTVGGLVPAFKRAWVSPGFSAYHGC